MGDHPPPWRWGGSDGDRCGGWLCDANDEWIMAPAAPADVAFASPVVRELLADAPEMEALLREWRQPCIERARWKRDQDDMGDRRDWDGLETSEPVPPVCGKCWSCRKFALLDRLDEARKTGHRG